VHNPVSAVIGLLVTLTVDSPPVEGSDDLVTEFFDRLRP
jgi:hypothetical protein